MGIKTLRIVECDICKLEIADQYNPWIDASTYGIVMHTECFGRLSAFQALRVLGLDDIQVVISDTDRRKLIYSAPDYIDLGPRSDACLELENGEGPDSYRKGTGR